MEHFVGVGPVHERGVRVAGEHGEDAKERSARGLGAVDSPHHGLEKPGATSEFGDAWGRRNRGVAQQPRCPALVREPRVRVERTHERRERIREVGGNTHTHVVVEGGPTQSRSGKGVR